MVDQLFADTYLAGVYDNWHPRSVRDDYDFDLPMIMAAEAVLDLGCGTGSLLHEARDAGHRGRLCGLDPAEGMIALARRRSDIEWVQSDLAAAGWSEAFDLIVMTGHAFQAVVGDEEIEALLSAAWKALKPGGRFAFETRNPSARAWERWRPENATSTTGPDGATVRITTQVVEPYDGRAVSFTHTFEGAHPSLPQLSRSTLRFLEAEDLVRRVAEAGFAVEACLGDFDGSPLTPGSPEIVIVAVR